MKKYLPFLFVFCFVACTDSAPNDPNALPNGVMQAVESTGAVEGGSWLPEIKQEQIPNMLLKK